MKTNKILTTAISIVFMLAWQADAQTYDTNNEVVQTFAGYGIPGYVDGQGMFTEFNHPSQIVADTANNLYVLDRGNFRIRKITPTGAVSTLAGGGTFFEGYGTNVSLAWLTAGPLAIDHANRLWLVMANGYGDNAYLLSIGTNGYVNIENGGLTNLNSSSGICFDSANNLYYSGGNRIYRYSPNSGNLQAFAGNGVAGNFDGQGPVFSALAGPASLACDRADNLYVWDSGNATIRRIDQDQNVTTIAGNNNNWYSVADGVGTNAIFAGGSASGGIAAMFSDNAGNIYFVCGSCVRKMNAQTNVVTLAGVFYQYSSSYADGAGNLARFNNASGGCFAQGMIYIADTGNNRIRNIALNQQSQVVSPASLQLNIYPGLQITGTIGRTYQIQVSPNMNTWTTVTTLLLGSSPYLWIDQNPARGSKFYRAVMLP